MKALFLYSNDTSGKNRAYKKRDYIVKKLSSKYEVVDKCCPSLDSFDYECSHASENFDALIIAGGDGTFNRAVNNIASLSEENRPILGYIPTGTINDAGKSYGIKFSIRRALKIILKGNISRSDICKVNDSFFLYVLAIGQYSDISYITPRKEKRKFGRISYYLLAIKEAFQIRKIKVHIETDKECFDDVTPFVLVMNGLYVGGFPVNFKNSTVDGKFDLYLTKPGLFNGLLHFIFFKVRTRHIVTSKMKISTNANMPWCIDGEKGLTGDVIITCLPKHVRVFSAK